MSVALVSTALRSVSHSAARTCTRGRERRAGERPVLREQRRHEGVGALRFDLAPHHGVALLALGQLAQQRGRGGRLVGQHGDRGVLAVLFGQRLGGRVGGRRQGQQALGQQRRRRGEGVPGGLLAQARREPHRVVVGVGRPAPPRGPATRRRPARRRSPGRPARRPARAPGPAAWRRRARRRRPPSPAPWPRGPDPCAPRRAGARPGGAGACRPRTSPSSWSRARASTWRLKASVASW